MDFLQVKFNSRSFLVAFIFAICLNYSATGYNVEYVIDGNDGVSRGVKPDVNFEYSRQRRDIAPAAAAMPAASAVPAPPPTLPAATNLPVVPSSVPTAPHPTSIDDSNKTTNMTAKAAVSDTVSVTRVPILGANGSGIWHVTEKSTAVSEPIVPDAGLNITDMFRETPEMIKAEHNLTAVTEDTHDFYNSSFIGNLTYFNEHWANISEPQADAHSTLSTSHRKATAVNLKFLFPFYGYVISNVTVATGGFLHTGEHGHSWLAATQYIAPLMANFDTTLSNDSVIKMSDDGEKFTTFWENVCLQEEPNAKFTFAVTLYKNGDIIFAYKNIPIPVQQINETVHPVKVGISDAFVTDKIVFYVRRKTIYEYHRANFMNHLITNNTILILKAMPTCLQYTDCQECINHNTAFNCSWCSQVQKCSSGTDKNKQDWTMRHCDKLAITNITMCPAKPVVGPSNGSTSYVTGSTDAVIRTFDDQPTPFKNRPRVIAPVDASMTSSHVEPDETRSPVGGVVAAFVTVALVCSLAAWTVYAFRNPHTRSGQLLIKYRPSQWTWRRGEARYTAATIHM